MRLVNSSSKSYQLESLPRPAHYAIVSHRWGEESEEILFTDFATNKTLPRRVRRGKHRGYDKIQGARKQAVQDGINYVWLDTCCIDRSNSTELSEAINSMYKWYQQSEVCYVYLHDVSDLSEFTKSDWFTRGWTLQELIAPAKLKFFTKDWHFLGTREDLIGPISEITGISHAILRSGKIPRDVTISQRMCWAAKRGTTKVEDRAYSLLGILGVNMPSIYGIDDIAFEDLQHKIIAKSGDQTLFSWYHAYMPTKKVKTEDVDSVSGLSIGNDDDTPPFNATGLLAFSPSHYLKSYEISVDDFRKNYVDRIRESTYRSRISIDNNYILIPLPVKHMAGKVWKAVLRCSFEPPGRHERQRPLVIYLKEISHLKYARVHLQVASNEREVKEKVGGVPVHDVSGVPGSLERLSDAELQLHGYVLREIDVLARYGEPPSDDPRTMVQEQRVYVEPLGEERHNCQDQLDESAPDEASPPEELNFDLAARPLYFTRATRPWSPPADLSYRARPFFRLAFGDPFDVLQELGPISTLVNPPMVDSEHWRECLVLVRARKGNDREAGEVGWALGSFLLAYIPPITWMGLE